jgi:hypothetical protein
MNSQSFHIEEQNLSFAWAKAFLKVMEPGVDEITPLIVSVNGFTDGIPKENHFVKEALDKALMDQGESVSHTIANTIFPRSLWNQRSERKLLYERYKNALQRIKKCPANKLGIYFNRLIAFENGQVAVNQLEHIIDTWHRGNHRHSALQAAIFDPRKDHKHSRQRGFPCLQQVDFAPIGPNGKEGLIVIGFYATQYIFQKAYGNYLGLCRLGEFMAHEMKLELTRMICITSIARLGIQSKTVLQNLEYKVQQIFASANDVK